MLSACSQSHLSSSQTARPKSKIRPPYMIGSDNRIWTPHCRKWTFTSPRYPLLVNQLWYNVHLHLPHSETVVHHFSPSWRMHGAFYICVLWHLIVPLKTQINLFSVSSVNLTSWTLRRHAHDHGQLIAHRVKTRQFSPRTKLEHQRHWGPDLHRFLWRHRAWYAVQSIGVDSEQLSM